MNDEKERKKVSSYQDVKSHLNWDDRRNRKKRRKMTTTSSSQWHNDALRWPCSQVTITVWDYRNKCRLFCMCHRKNFSKKVPWYETIAFSQTNGRKKRTHKTTKGEWMDERLQKYVMLMSLSQNHYSRFVCFSIRWFGSLVCSSSRSLFHFIFFSLILAHSLRLLYVSFRAPSIFGCLFSPSMMCLLLFSLFSVQCSMFKALSEPSLIVGFVISIILIIYYYYYHCNKRSENGKTNTANLFRRYT